MFSLLMFTVKTNYLQTHRLVEIYDLQILFVVTKSTLDSNITPRSYATEKATSYLAQTTKNKDTPDRLTQRLEGFCFSGSSAVAGIAQEPEGHTAVRMACRALITQGLSNYF